MRALYNNFLLPKYYYLRIKYNLNKDELIEFLIHILNWNHINVYIIYHFPFFLLLLYFPALVILLHNQKVFILVSIAIIHLYCLLPNYFFHITVNLFCINFNINIFYQSQFRINFFKMLNFLPFIINIFLRWSQFINFYSRFKCTLICYLQFHLLILPL